MKADFSFTFCQVQFSIIKIHNCGIRLSEFSIYRLCNIIRDAFYEYAHFVRITAPVQEELLKNMTIV